MSSVSDRLTADTEERAGLVTTTLGDAAGAGRLGND
jgi:hypothetical protein